jgi:hypothetical protein
MVNVDPTQDVADDPGIVTVGGYRNFLISLVPSFFTRVGPNP